MSCQGCGRDSETRLCCPTCIEFGQTSFFCGQECFTKNWAQHSQVHESLRRKKAEESGAQAPKARPQKPPPPKETTYSAYPRGMGAPLPGGMPLVKSFASQGLSARAGLAKKSDDAPPSAVATTGGMFSWVDQAKQIFTGTAPARDAAGSRSGLRERSPAPAVRPDKAPPAKPKQTFPLQTGLWVLIIFTVCVGGILYVQHQRLSEEPSPNGQAALSAAAAAVINVGSEAKDEPSEEGKGTATDLRAEVAALKDMVEKHEKMLRYVMERYVEKDMASSSGPRESASGAKQATVANLSSLVEGPTETKAEARAGDAPRKRKTGASDSMVGMPQPEGVA